MEYAARGGLAGAYNQLWNEIGRLVDTFTPFECANYFAAAGSDPT